MIKKLMITAALFFSLLGASLLHSGIASAEENLTENEISESTLNKWLEEAGAPVELINRWGYEQKLSLYEKGDKVEYVTSNVEEFVTLQEDNEDQFTTYATIPTKSLRVSHDIFRTYDGSSQERYTFYANYEWLTLSTRSLFNGSVKNDKVGIALPSGWSIVAGSDQCKEFQSGTGPGFSNNPIAKGNCDGGLYDANFYGYAWSLTGNADVFHSGWVSLKASRSSNAKIEVISQYAQAVNSSTSFTTGWGPLSVTFNSSSDINKRSWHTEK